MSRRADAAQRRIVRSANRMLEEVLALEIAAFQRQQAATRNAVQDAAPGIIEGLADGSPARARAALRAALGPALAEAGADAVKLGTAARSSSVAAVGGELAALETVSGAGDGEHAAAAAVTASAGGPDFAAGLAEDWSKNRAPWIVESAEKVITSAAGALPSSGFVVPSHSVVKEAIATGGSFAALSEQVGGAELDDLFGKVSTVLGRVQQIARHYSVVSMENARLQAMSVYQGIVPTGLVPVDPLNPSGPTVKALGAPRVYKQLVATVDERTTLICLSCAGQIREWDKPYRTIQGEYPTPPFHIHCRSVSVPYVPGATNEIRDAANNELKNRPLKDRAKVDPRHVAAHPTGDPHIPTPAEIAAGSWPGKKSKKKPVVAPAPPAPAPPKVAPPKPVPKVAAPKPLAKPSVGPDGAPIPAPEKGDVIIGFSASGKPLVLSEVNARANKLGPFAPDAVIVGYDTAGRPVRASAATALQRGWPSQVNPLTGEKFLPVPKGHLAYDMSMDLEVQPDQYGKVFTDEAARVKKFNLGPYAPGRVLVGYDPDGAPIYLLPYQGGKFYDAWGHPRPGAVAAALTAEPVGIVGAADPVLADTFDDLLQFLPGPNDPRTTSRLAPDDLQLASAWARALPAKAQQAFRLYSTTVYRRFNSALRQLALDGTPLSPKHKGYRDAMEAALTQAPRWSRPVLTFRGVEITLDDRVARDQFGPRTNSVADVRAWVAATYTPGAVIHPAGRAFGSSSLSPAVARSFARVLTPGRVRGIIFEIVSTGEHSAPAWTVSTASYENEILFGPSAEFTVAGVQYDVPYPNDVTIPIVVQLVHVT